MFRQILTEKVFYLAHQPRLSPTQRAQLVVVIQPVHESAMISFLHSLPQIRQQGTLAMVPKTGVRHSESPLNIRSVTRGQVAEASSEQATLDRDPYCAVANTALGHLFVQLSRPMIIITLN